MAKYHGFNKAAFGHVIITDESDIKRMTYFQGQPFGMNGEILLMQKTKQRGGKVRTQGSFAK
jgi:hypothetical protein